jgi:pimeloyl-ACP methyl ester carboxylesterase
MPRSDAVGAKIWTYQRDSNNTGQLALYTATNFNTSAPTYIITHGFGGLYQLNGQVDASYQGLVNSLPTNSNVLFVDWATDSNTTTPEQAANHIVDDAASAYNQLIAGPLGTDPNLWSNVTMMGSSFGSYLNLQIAQIANQTNGLRAGLWVGLDPASTLGLSGSSYNPGNEVMNGQLASDFANSISLHTYSFYDNQNELGQQTIVLLTPPSMRCTDHLWCLNSMDAHGYARTFLAQCLADHICTIGGNPGAPKTTAILEPNGNMSVPTSKEDRTIEAACRDFVISASNTTDAQGCSAAIAAAYKASHVIGNFSGVWTGTYMTIIDSGTCGNVGGGGNVTLSLSQKGGKVTGTIVVPNDWFYWDTNCQVTSRSDHSDEWTLGLTVSGLTASGGGTTLSQNAGTTMLNGSFGGHNSTGYYFTTTLSNLRRH